VHGRLRSGACGGPATGGGAAGGGGLARGLARPCLQSFRRHFKGIPDPHAHLQLATALP
jgi:hypothetical protein